MDPQQELFTALLAKIRGLGYDVYDGFLPPEDTPYPFVYLADSQQVDDMGNKTAIWGNVFQTIHVWHSNPKKRGTASGMMLQIKQAARDISRTEHFSWQLKNTNQRFLSDNTTAQPLLHGILELEFKFN